MPYTQTLKADVFKSATCAIAANLSGEEYPYTDLKKIMRECAEGFDHLAANPALMPNIVEGFPIPHEVARRALITFGEGGTSDAHLLPIVRDVCAVIWTQLRFRELELVS